MSYANTQLLLPMRGVNGGTSFADYSLHNWSITVNGNAQTSTAQSKFYGSSGLFDGGGDYLTVPLNIKLNILTTWTISIWFRCSFKDDTTRCLISGLNSSGNTGWNFNVTDGNKMNFYYPAASQVLGATDVTADGSWHHAYVCRSSGVLYLGLDGSEEDTTALGGTASSNNDNIRIGRNPANSAQDFAGNLQDIRIIDGTALYTGGDYTPPARLTAPISNANTTAVLDSGGSPAERKIWAVPHLTSGTANRVFGTDSDGSGEFELWVPSAAAGAEHNVLFMDPTAIGSGGLTDILVSRVSAS